MVMIVMKIEKVFVTGEVHPTCVDILRSNGIQAVQKIALTKEELLNEIPSYDGLIVGPSTRVTADVISAGKSLKIIGQAGTDLSNIYADAATRKGIIVMNTPEGNTVGAAEHTCTLLIGLARNVGPASMSMKEGKWDHNKFVPSELFGKTLAFIGLGGAAKEVALRMQAFGMTTIGFDPLVGADQSALFNTQWLSLEEIWPRADYITVHTPLVAQTKNLINDAVLAKCKRGVYIVNCAQGGIVNEEALLRALESGQCGGAGLDVFVREPPKNYRLIKHPLVVATPHLGITSVEAKSRAAERIAMQLVDLVQRGCLTGAINARALVHALSSASLPWVQLGERLGMIGSLLTKDLSLKNVEVLIYGESIKDCGSYMTAAVMAGYLTAAAVDHEDLLPSHLNLINAPLYAKQCGIIITSTVKNESDPDTETVKVQFQGAGGEVFELQGTVSGGNSLLLSAQGNKFIAPAILRGNAVIYNVHKDVALSEILAAATRDGLDVVAVSVSEVMNSQGFGVISANCSVATKLSNLCQTVNSAYACVL